MWNWHQQQHKYGYRKQFRCFIYKIIRLTYKKHPNSWWIGIHTFLWLVLSIFKYVHTWYHTISKAFIRENINPSTLYRAVAVAGWSRARFEVCSLYIYIYSGGQMGWLTRFTCRHVCHTRHKCCYCIFTRLRPFSKRFYYAAPVGMIYAMSSQCQIRYIDNKKYWYNLTLSFWIRTKFNSRKHTIRPTGFVSYSSTCIW